MSTDQICKSFKVAILGNLGVGKTAIINKFKNNQFDPEIASTIGAKPSTVTASHDGHEVELVIWDTAGQERYRSLCQVYLRSAKAVIIVYSIIDRDSFNSIEEWLNESEQKSTDSPIYFLVGNKTDLLENNMDVISFNEGNNKASELEMTFFQTSAKNGDGINELFEGIVGRLYKEKDSDGADNKNIIDLEKDEIEKSPKSCC